MGKLALCLSVSACGDLAIATGKQLSQIYRMVLDWANGAFAYCPFLVSQLADALFGAESESRHPAD